MWSIGKYLFYSCNAALALMQRTYCHFLHVVLTAAHDIVLVTPTWNDSKRLEVFGGRLAEALAAASFSVRWIISDDGSSAEEKACLEELVGRFASIHGRTELLLSNQHLRKGGAVYRAWNACPEAHLLAFVDADGAVSPTVVIELLTLAIGNRAESAFVGVRCNSHGAQVERSLPRALSFRLFAFLARRLLQLDLQDTQCGVKVVPGAAYRAIASSLREQGFVFDIELLLALRQHRCRIVERPIPWREVSGGKVRLSRDAWSMIAGLLRIRKRYHS